MYKKCKVSLCREYVKQPEVYCDKHKGNTATHTISMCELIHRTKGMQSSTSQVNGNE